MVTVEPIWAASPNSLASRLIVSAGTVVARMQGNARDMLTAERLQLEGKAPAELAVFANGVPFGIGPFAVEPFSVSHDAVDPVPVACEIVQALQTLVTRRIDAFDPVVLTVTQIEAGTTTNVIPESVRMLGTIRSTSERARSRAQEGLRRVATQVAAAHAGSPAPAGTDWGRGSQASAAPIP